MTQPEPEYYAEYKCPGCGKTATVTNVCRSCRLSMYATGWATKHNPDGPDFRHRLTLALAPKEYEEAYEWNLIIRQSAKLHGRPVPRWAWFPPKQKTLDDALPEEDEEE